MAPHPSLSPTRALVGVVVGVVAGGQVGGGELDRRRRAVTRGLGVGGMGAAGQCQHGGQSAERRGAAVGGVVATGADASERPGS